MAVARHLLRQSPLYPRRRDVSETRHQPGRPRPAHERRLRAQLHDRSGPPRWVCRLHPEDRELIAQLIERLGESAPPSSRSSAAGPAPGGFGATAEDIARRHGVKAAWVRTNGDALGGRRLGSGPKPRWRFNPAIADQRIATMRADRHAVRTGSDAPDQPRYRRSKSTPVPLLPVKGRAPTS